MSDLTPESLCQQPRLGKRARADSNADEPRGVRTCSPDKRDEHVERDGHDEGDEYNEHDDHNEHNDYDEEQRAQKAFRQRTRDYIADLEERLATQARTSSRKAAKLTSEVQALRRRCQALQRRLDSIGQIAGGPGGDDGMNKIHENHDRHDNYRSQGAYDNQTQDNYRNDGNHNYDKDDNITIVSNSRLEQAATDAGHGDALRGHNANPVTTQTQQLPSPAATYNLMASPMTTTANSITNSTIEFHDVAHLGTHHATPPSHPSPATPHPPPSRSSRHSQRSPLQHSQSSPIEPLQHPKPPTHAHREPELASSPNATHLAPYRNQEPYAASAIRSKHLPPTCPLDRILLNLLDSGNDMIAHGSSMATVLGPAKGIVTGFLDQNLAATVHPISRIISEILSTFPNVALPEQMGMFYKMHLTLRWQISLTPETYTQMPIWLRPTVTQITVPHAAWIDNIPWPGVRDLLISHPDDYPFEVFSEYYSQNVSVNWPFDDSDAVAQENGNIVLHSIFEKHVQKLENWTISHMFQARFPEISHIISGGNKDI